jgi:hypothetical protein
MSRAGLSVFRERLTELTTVYGQGFPGPLLHVPIAYREAADALCGAATARRGNSPPPAGNGDPATGDDAGG